MENHTTAACAGQSALTTTGSSIILTLHARYEAAWEAYNKIDEAKPRSVDQERQDLYFRCERGMQEVLAEIDALRAAILHQIPTNDAELSILAYHLWANYDAQTSHSETEKDALERAMCAMLDYLIGESRIDMERAGKQFHNGAMIAFTRIGTRKANAEALEIES